MAIFGVINIYPNDFSGYFSFLGINNFIFFMFGKKKKDIDDSSQEPLSGLASDLIVHNMPNREKLNGATGPSSIMAAGFSLAETPDKNNARTVGIIIVGVGFVLISVLVYLSYRFIIVPAMGNNQKAEPIKNQIISETNLNDNEKLVTEIATKTEIILASTTDFIDLNSLSSSSPEVGASSSVRELSMIIDTDEDGISDDEEAVLGTNAASPDSDNDTYPDQSELDNGYDPASKGKIGDNINLSTYNNLGYIYSILYPKEWEIKSLDNGAALILTAPDNSIIQISAQENTNHETILGWYNYAFPNITVTYDKLKSINDWDGLNSEDGSNFYLTDKDRKNILVISYIQSSEEGRIYPNIYKLVINSLKFKK